MSLHGRPKGEFRSAQHEGTAESTIARPAAAAEQAAKPGDKLLVGLIGAGIQRSLTPAMQEEEARAQGIRLHYQLIDLDRSAQGADALPSLIAAARSNIGRASAPWPVWSRSINW